jgi:hypothetical protein
MKLLSINKKIRLKNKEKSDTVRQVVRDLRGHEFFIVDNIFIDEYSGRLGASASCVYFVLCRHADKDQTCFPSEDRIAGLLGTSRWTVIRGIKKLEDHRIIKVNRENKRVNFYTLLNKSQWRKFSAVQREGVGGKEFLAKSCMGCKDFESPACERCTAGSHNKSLKMGV